MIQLLIDPRRRNIGSFEVGRVLPSARRRMVGPFIFFDHLGPVDLPKGLPREADVRHIRISGFPPSPTCSLARSCTATPRAWSRRSDPAR